VRAERARGSAFRSSARTTNEVRGTGFEEGLRPPKDGANLRSIWSGPRRARLFGGARCGGSSARAVPVRGRTKAKAKRVVTPPRRTRNRSELAVSARASSYCRSRQNVLGLREARHRYRSGRKPARYHGASEREPDHRRSRRRASAGAHRRQKGGGSSKLGDPHHVSAASSLKAARFRSCFGAGGMRAGIYRQKAPWIGKAHAFHEAPAEPILAASEHPTRIRRKAKPGGRHGGGDRGVRGGRVSMSHGGRKRPRVNIVRSPK